MSRQGIGVAAFYVVGGALALALARPDLWVERADAAVTRAAYDVTILCATGGVKRSGGVLAEGATCVLADAHGGHDNSQAIIVYEAGAWAP